MQRVTELDHPPVPGKHYLVPCIRLKDDRNWLPILEPLHDDVEIILFPEPHWHYDWRFWIPDVIEELFFPFCFATDDLTDLCGQVARRDMVVGEPVWKWRICRRQMPTFPTHLRRLNLQPTSDAKEVSFLRKLEQAYRDRYVTCNKCPHRGIALDTMPQQDGVVVCPGHGLAWNVATGEAVRRVS